MSDLKHLLKTLEKSIKKTEAMNEDFQKFMKETIAKQKKHLAALKKENKKK